MVIQSGYSGPRRSWTERALAAARLDSSLYEEVEADKTATWQAAGVVAVSAVAQGIAALHHGTNGIIGSLLGALIAWVVAAAVVYLVGATLFKGTANVGELMRTLGFAQAPGVFYVLGLIPVLGWLATPIVAIWILIADIIAIRQALDIDTWKAIVTAFVAWLVVMIPLIVLGGAAFLAFR